MRWSPTAESADGHVLPPAQNRRTSSWCTTRSSFDIRWRPASRCRRATARTSSRSTARSELPGGGRRRPELVHRVQRARRPVGALVRPLRLFRHADRRRPGRARPAARRCAAAATRTFALYPALGAFLSARRFQATRRAAFLRSQDLGGSGVQPDQFLFQSATRMIEREREHGPMFLFVYLAANHFPWDHRYRPDLTPRWQDPGNAPPVDEYLRRQAMSAQRLRRFSRAAEARFSRRAVPDRPLRRPSAGFRLAHRSESELDESGSRAG